MQSHYFVTDTHGMAKHFAVLRDWIRSDSGGEAVITILGDLSDRGPDAKGCLQIAVELLDEFPDSALILGNHDWYLREALTEGRSSQQMEWFSNGGKATMDSYGVEFDFRKRMDFSVLKDVLPSSHQNLLNSAISYKLFGSVLAVHAGIMRGRPPEQQTEYDLMWDRSVIRDDYEDGVFLIHGHSPMKKPYIGCNRIGLDTGCFATGRLTALKISANGKCEFKWTKTDASGMEDVEPAVLQGGDLQNPLRHYVFAAEPGNPVIKPNKKREDALTLLAGCV